MTETTTSPAESQPRNHFLCIAHSRGLTPEESRRNSASSSRFSNGHDATTLNSALLRSAGAATASGSYSYLWDNGQDISFCFLDGGEHQKRKVKEVMQEWTWYANIAFVKKDDCDASAAIRISFRGKGSWSYMGKAALAATRGRTMQYDCIWDTKELLAEERTTILHEFGHALGLLHEHQSPARPFDWNVSQVFASYGSQGYDDDFIRDNVLYMYNASEVSNYSAFDPYSIMAYDMKPELNSAGIRVDVNNELSDMDKAYMVINYPRTKPDGRAAKWTLERALDIAGVPPKVSRKWKRLPVWSIRKAFTEWQAAERAKEKRLNVVRVRISGKDFYMILCNATLPEFKRHSQVGRRHSEFEEFRDALAAGVKNIPQLPGRKEFLWSSWPCYRQRKLLEWLQLLSEHEEFEMLKDELRRFLQEEDYSIGSASPASNTP